MFLLSFAAQMALFRFVKFLGVSDVFAHLFPLTSLLLGVALLLLGSGLLTTLLAIRGGIEGFNAQVLGMLGSAFFSGYLAGTFAIPPLIRRVGHIRSFAFLTAAVACMVILHELFPVPWFWIGLRFLTGISMVGLYTVIESWLNSYAPAEQRANIFSVYMAVNLGALALAQQFLHWAPVSGHILFSIAAVIVCAAVMPVSTTRLSQPAIEGVATLGLFALYRKAPVAFLTALFSGLAMGAFWGLSVVWADRSGMSNADVATFMSFSIIGGALLQWPIGWITDKIDRGSVISVVALSAAGLALLQMFAGGPQPIWTLLIGFCYGGFAFALYPLAVARMMDRLVPGEVLSGNGSLLLLHGLGAALGPVIVGSAMMHLGAWTLPAWYCVIETVLAVLAWLLAQQSPADIEQQTHFVAMVRTAPIAIDLLDPDQEKDSTGSVDVDEPVLKEASSVSQQVE